MRKWRWTWLPCEGPEEVVVEEEVVEEAAS